MAGNATQTQSRRRRAEPPALPDWCVVTGDGALRITPGLILGESSSGTLNFNDPDPQHQWIEFGFAGDGAPWMRIVRDDKSLRVAGSACRGYPLRSGATIRLPNHTLYVSRDIRMPRRAGTVIDVVQADLLERLRAATSGVAGRRRPFAVAGLAAAVVLAVATALGLLVDPADRVPGASRAAIVSDGGPPVPAERVQADPMAPLVPMTPAAPVRPVEHGPSAGVGAPSGATAPAGADVASVVRPAGVDADAASPAPVEPVEDALAAEPEAVAVLPSAAPPAPIVLAPVARRALPASVPDPDPPAPEPPAPAAPPPVAAVRAPDATRGEAARSASASAAAARLRREQDLLAADLALAQGRLTFPPEANAYALYHRVLAADPASPEALSGLQAVRQELINRALAQLAGNDLEGSRRTLQAAADAGADARLVADLRDEVDYRQRRMEGR